MKRKQSETYLGNMMRLYKFRADKGRDRGYVSCPNCHKHIKTCPHCQKDMLLPKAKKKLDYIVSFDWTEIECKQGEESWNMWDFTPAQEELLKTPEEKPRWLFLLLGGGKAPNGKEAYLIRLSYFLKVRISEEVAGRKSIRFESTPRSKVKEAKELFGEYQLEWVTGDGWVVPEKHPFWKQHFPVDVIDEILIKEAQPQETEENNDSGITPTPTRLADMEW